MADERVVQFLRGMDIKKVSIGGFDKLATFEKFKELVALYDQIIAENRQAAAEEAEQRFVAAAVPQPEDTARLNALMEENKQQTAKIAALEARLAAEQHISQIPVQQPEDTARLNALMEENKQQTAKIAALEARLAAEQHISQIPAQQTEDTARLNALVEDSRQKAAKISALEARLAEDAYTINDYMKKIEALKNEASVQKKTNEDWESKLQEEREQMLNDARYEARQICKDAQMEALRHRSSVMEEVAAVRKERKDIFAELMLVQDQLNELLAKSICDEK